MVPLSEIVTIQQGLQFRKGLDDLPSGPYRLIQIRDFDEVGELREDWSQALLRFAPPSPVDRYLLAEGDILFLAKGLRNFAWPVLEPMPRVVPVGYFFILRPDPDRVNSAYLSWYLNSDPARAHLRSSAAQGTHMPVVNRTAFERLPVPLPSLERQATIAHLEALRRREARLMHRLEDLRRTLLSAAMLRSANRFDQPLAKAH